MGAILFSRAINLVPVCQLFPVIRRGDAFLLFENAAEIEGVVVTDDGGNLRHVVVCTFQKTDRAI